jgi:hypothetical protein
MVLCPIEVELGIEELEEKAQTALGDQHPVLEFRRIVIRNVTDLARNVRSSGANVAVVPTNSPVLPPAAIETLLSRFSGPVMLVGGNADAEDRNQQ